MCELVFGLVVRYPIGDESMAAVTQPTVRRGLALWSSVRSSWMSYFVLLDLREAPDH
jgi:hypothetical protein